MRQSYRAVRHSELPFRKRLLRRRSTAIRPLSVSFESSQRPGRTPARAVRRLP
ncbi:hypothetical protein SXIM_01570 [Streptomyces xiamenensis]|uniref:Uncharacterized protein n=1 Tax=Streptomyces xiamenensis TaxID=408015 RepID=A0A0F7CMP9_9ACTN|nr:hypothetical protein SXIM_01570 [Streptomyces xiamenensis]